MAARLDMDEPRFGWPWSDDPSAPASDDPTEQDAD